MKTKTKIHAIALVLLVGAVVFLGITWWINGRDDTWLYATCVIIVLSSMFPIFSEIKKDKDR